MSPGSMPQLRVVRPRRTVNYRGRKLRSHRSDAPVVFGRVELPVATINTSSAWWHQKLAWCRPRLVPAFAALLGLIGLLAVGRHMLDLAHGGNAIATAPVIEMPATIDL